MALCKEPDAGLNPGTPGSCPGPKAGAKLLSHPGFPGFTYSFFLFKDFIYLFIHKRYTQRERPLETQAVGEAGSMQGV